MQANSAFSQKENNFFKRALKCCETKQYKHGLKLTNIILSNPKHAVHGEVLSLKGLLSFHLGRKDEAYELVKKGLKFDLKSCLSWHTYGILQRSDRNYEEAVKCFRNALKWDSENVQILQDMSTLQIQTKDMDGYLDSCCRILSLVPTQHAAWIGFALAHHLAGEYAICLDIIKSIRQNMSMRTSSQSELSELLLYQSSILEESGDLEGAIRHLRESKELIFDKLSVEESLAQLLLQTNRFSEASEIIHSLIKRNPHCTTYYKWLFQSQNIKTDGQKVKYICSLIEKMPNVSVLKRMILTFSSGEEFQQHVDSYLKQGLRKGIPSLFVDLKRLYDNDNKRQFIESLMLSYEKSLKNSKSFPEDRVKKEHPTVLLWTLHFLAQHYNYSKSTEKALKYIDEAILHTPTLVDLYAVRAKILKNAGDNISATVCIDEAQSLDTSDRYINSKCVKYFLDSNMIDEAEELATNFCFNGTSGTVEILNEMQCIWFLARCALAYERLGNLGEALKKCHEVNNHFLQFWQDQMDFHYYSLRNVCLRQYVRLIRQSSQFKNHKFYNIIANCAIRIYLKIFDNPLNDDGCRKNNENDVANSEFKKLRNKERKALKKAEMSKIEKRDTKIKDDTKSSLDPNKLERTKEPLEEAKKYLIPLQLLISHEITTHIMAYEVYSRKRKVLLMLQSLLRAHAVGCDSPSLHEILIRFALEIDDLKSSGRLKYPILDVLEKRMGPILLGRTPSEINELYFLKNSRSLPARLAFGKSMYLLDEKMQQEALSIVTLLSSDMEGVCLKTCQKVLNAMRDGSLGTCHTYIEDYRKKCHDMFPYATDFAEQAVDS